MKRTLLGITVVALLLVPMLAGQKTAGQKQKMHAASAARIARGKYLAEQVGLCGDCHTPRDEKGEPIKERWLMGATLDFKPIAPVPVWADKAPGIAGLPGWENNAAITFLVTGVAANGLPRRPPMPQYRFNVQDAQAIVAYLKSLEAEKEQKR